MIFNKFGKSGKRIALTSVVMGRIYPLYKNNWMFCICVISLIFWTPMVRLSLTLKLPQVSLEALRSVAANEIIE